MAKPTDPKAPKPRWLTCGGPLLLVWTTAKRTPRPETPSEEEHHDLER